MSEIRLQEPVIDLDAERIERLNAVQGCIILVKKPNDDKLYGPVENSFSLGIEPNRTFFYWTARDTNGLDWATKDVAYWQKQYPEYEYTIYDARDAEKLPIVINWPVWLDAHSPSDKTFAGIKNKYDARNLKFTVKGAAPDKTTTSPALTMAVTSTSLV